ncbi:MAG TPA: universal stress protein [Bacteroidia bacterium]|nr:universal stress protein [Bacteroidia bacterium]
MKILVPIDFTPVTENALSYALQLSPSKKVVLFHVVNSAKEIASAEAKLNDLISKYKSKFSGELSALVHVGNIFETIGEAAIEVVADLIVMGTHGVKGMQHIVGSKAMKVITNSKTPYIVVQHKPFKEIKNILVPVDFTRESKQILPFLVSLAKVFNADLQLIRQSHSKDEFIKNKIDNNLSYFRGMLESEGCKFTMSENEFSYDSRYKGILKEAVALDSDLIVTAIDPALDVANYIMGVEEQKIVANEAQIPVLCINIKNFMKQSGNIFEATA